MVPRVLAEWNIIVIQDLLTKCYYESEYYDLKETLPHKSDENGKHRLSTACCAFANNLGGFLVFGIKDDKALSIVDRLVGIESDIDFPEHFGNYPRQCSPSVEWAFMNPPLQLSNGNVIHIIHVPKSWNAPHSVIESNGRMVFPKRTNKGDECMSYEEVRNSFLGYYEKRVKLQLLLAELQTINVIAEQMIIAEDKRQQYFSTSSFRLNIIESVISDTFTLLAEQQELIANLMIIRNQCQVVNNIVSFFLSQEALPLNDKLGRRKRHNETMESMCSLIMNKCSEAVKYLQEFLNR